MLHILKKKKRNTDVTLSGIIFNFFLISPFIKSYKLIESPPPVVLNELRYLEYLLIEATPFDMSIAVSDDTESAPESNKKL